MYEFAKVAGWLLAPLTVVLLLLGAALGCRMLRARRAALVLAVCATALLWAASTPWVALQLAWSLERRHPALTPEATPSADAIVVLGGALAGAAPPRRPTFGLGRAASRVWHAAALYRAGKAPWIIVAAGNQPGHAHVQVEAEAIVEMLLTLGVPRSAIRSEGKSRTTRENALQTQQLLQDARARRVLLVTSARHMERALLHFRKVGAHSQVEFVPATTDVTALGSSHQLEMWFPTASALEDVTNSVKEYAGMLQLAMI